MREDNKLITAVIVNWNTSEALELCLGSLATCGELIHEIVVVDNASSDGSTEMVRALFPEVRLLASTRNLGFAGANNLALREATGDYILTLNPDVEVDPQSLRMLTKCLEENPACAAVSPALVGVDERIQNYLYRRFPSPLQILLFWTALGLVFGRIGFLRRRFLEYAPPPNRIVAVDQLPGAAILVRRSAYMAIGPWDAGYFLWFEDVDLSYRLKAAGFWLLVVGPAVFFHRGGTSFRSWSIGRRIFQFYRGYFRFLCKHGMRGLSRFSIVVLGADLAIKQLGFQLGRIFHLTTDSDVQMLRRTRQEIVEVARRCADGDIVEFSESS